MTIYYADTYQAEQPAASCTKQGEVKVVKAAANVTTALASADSIYLARIPANHRVIRIDAWADDWDDGNFTCDIGNTDNADAYADDAQLGRSAGFVSFPGGTGSVTTIFTDTPPDEDYDVIIDPTVVGTGDTGYVYATIYYTVDQVLPDATDSPAVVAGTQ
jgi:hypothetical protein